MLLKSCYSHVENTSMLTSLKVDTETHKPSLTLPLYIEVPVLSQELAGHVCIRGINSAYFTHTKHPSRYKIMADTGKFVFIA